MRIKIMMYIKNNNSNNNNNIIEIRIIISITITIIIMTITTTTTTKILDRWGVQHHCAQNGHAVTSLNCDRDSLDQEIVGHFIA